MNGQQPNPLHSVSVLIREATDRAIHETLLHRWEIADLIRKEADIIENCKEHDRYADGSLV